MRVSVTGASTVNTSGGSLRTSPQLAESLPFVSDRLQNADTQHMAAHIAQSGPGYLFNNNPTIQQSNNLPMNVDKKNFVSV